jgi:hypothetical protein
MSAVQRQQAAIWIRSVASAALLTASCHATRQGSAIVEG